MRPLHNPEVRRRLAGFVDASPRSPHGWEARRTGSAAIECAFAAAGLLEVARFVRPNAWDVAGGFALVRAAGGSVRRPDGSALPYARTQADYRVHGFIARGREA